MLADGSVFLGRHLVRPGDKQMPQPQDYLHDGKRFWRLASEYDPMTEEHRWRIREIDPQTGKELRESVPAWFEETDGGTIAFGAAELVPAPPGAESSPLGTKDGMLGWKTVKRRDGGYVGQGIDGRRWDKPLQHVDGSPAVPVGLLRQPGSSAYLPVTTNGARVGSYWIWDPSGATVITIVQDFACNNADGQVTVLPLPFWHFLHVRDEASSAKLRAIGDEPCAALLQAAAADREQQKPARRGSAKVALERSLPMVTAAVKELLPAAPERMVKGVAGIIADCEAESAAFTALRDKSNTGSQSPTTGAALGVHRQSDIAAGFWGMPSIYTNGRDADLSVSAHLAAAAAFFKGEAKTGDLPGTNYLWFSMLEDLHLRAWQAFWRATAARLAKKDSENVPWLAFLKHWHVLGIAELPGQFDVMEGHPEGAKKNTWGGFDIDVEAGASFALENGVDRFIGVEIESYGQQAPYQFLRYSTADKPGPPPGYKVQNVRRIKTAYDPRKWPRSSPRSKRVPLYRCRPGRSWQGLPRSLPHHRRRSD